MNPDTRDVRRSRPALPPADRADPATDALAGTDPTDPDADGEESYRPPPVDVTDGEDREIAIRAYGGGADPLVPMYERFEPEDRAQGIPPLSESRIRSWLGTLLEEGLNVVARHDGAVVGHAALVPMDDGRHELAVFVAPAYQSAGVGTALVRALLGHGRANGVDRVWLTVSRRNRIAIRLYETVGFRTLEEGREYEMERDL